MKIIKDLIIGLPISIFLSVLLLEVFTSDEYKVYHKVMSDCDFNASSITPVNLVYEYWGIRNVQVKTIENKNELIEGLFSIFLYEDGGCNASAIRELELIATQGYKFNEYKDHRGLTWILKETFISNPLTVEWLINNGGFVNSKVENESSPYFGQDIFELAVSLDKFKSTDRTKKILFLLENKKALCELCL